MNPILSPLASIAALALVAALPSQTLVVPDNCNLSGPTITTSTWRSTAGHFQVAYDATNFTNAGVTGPILITNLAFRARDGQPDLGGHVYTGVSVEVGECTVDHMVLSSTFSANRGTMGPLGTTSVTVTPADGSVPNDYVIHIDLLALGSAYLYDPTLGNDLLIDITFAAPTPTTNLVTLAAGSGTIATARARMCSTSSVTSLTGSLLAPPVMKIGFAGSGGYPGELPARLERIGHCCGGTFQSFYQDWQISEPFDLANTSITLTPNSPVGPTSYVVALGNTAPDLTKVNLTPDSVADTALVTFPLGFTFPYVSGTTTTIKACTDGYVWLDSAMTLADLTPAVGELLGIAAAQTARVAPFWFNFHAGRNTVTHPGSGLHVLTDTSGGPGNAVCYVTWNKVGISMQTAVGGASLNDMQLVLHEATGVMEMRYGTMSVGMATLGVTGFSPGRIGTVASFHPGPRDLSMELPLVTGPDSGAQGLSHGTSNQIRPIVGTSITFQSYNQPLGTALGLFCLDLASLEPSVHVPGLMAPGCGISLSPTFLISEVAIAPAATWTSLPFPIQTSWLGYTLYSQWVAADANLLLSTSNGLKLTIGLN